jgi:hypothetical protein
MADDIFPHKDIVKYPLALYLLPQIPGVGPALKIMGVNDLAEVLVIYPGKLRNFASDKFMQAGYAYP